MLSDVIEFLACPHCGGALSLLDASLRCHDGHTFDVARQGYVNLLAGAPRPATGDTRAMVAARAAFLGGGHYATIAQAVAAEAQDTSADGQRGCVVDLGAGTGYHLAAVLDRLRTRPGLAMDASKHAARLAARAHRHAGAVVCDTWRGLPVRTGAAALALNVFAPRNAAETRRILRQDGALVVVTATPRHLQELVAVMGLLTVDARKPQRLDDALRPFFALVRQSIHEYAVLLPRAAVEAAAAMGPSAWHTDPPARHERVNALPEQTTATVSVTVAVYRPLG